MRLTQLFNPSGIEYLKFTGVDNTNLVAPLIPEEDCDYSDSVSIEDSEVQAIVTAQIKGKGRSKPCTEHPQPEIPFPPDVYDNFIKATACTETGCDCSGPVNTGNGAYGCYQIRKIFYDDLVLWYCTPGPGYNSTVCKTIKSIKWPDGVQDNTKAQYLIDAWLKGRYAKYFRRLPGESMEDWMRRVRNRYYGHPDPAELERDFQRFWKFWRDNGGPLS